MLGDEVVGVLDIDAANYGEFSLEDEKWLKILLDEIAQLKQFEWFKKNM
jgi:putative methionine-R-sulfoxide reductase with GAF domain